MAREFVGAERDQMLLMPPSLLEWLPEEHLVWTVIGAVDHMDLERFRVAYRVGAAGRAPYDPAMLGALLLYSYARGSRSSRHIERAYYKDVAYKVITGMLTRTTPGLRSFAAVKSWRSPSCLTMCSVCVRRRGWCRSG